MALIVSCFPENQLRQDDCRLMEDGRGIIKKPGISPGSSLTVLSLSNIIYLALL